MGVVWWRVRTTNVPVETFKRAAWWEGQQVEFPRFTPGKNGSETYNAQMDVVMNQIAQKRRWTVAEVEALHELAMQPFELPKERKEILFGEMEPYMVSTMAVTLLGDWLGVGAPIDLEARALAEHMLLELLDHPNWVLRQEAIVAIVNSGMIADDFARNAVLSKASDPDPDVARTVGEQMAKYEHLLQRAEQARHRRERSDG